MKTRLAIAMAMVMLSGCTTNPHLDGSTQPVSDQVRGEPNLVAVCVGLTYVNPVANGGWDGACPGCDVDARGLFNLFTKKNFTAKLLLNSAATWDQVRSTIVQSAKDLKSDDLLVVTMSGHGGQVTDDNGDEIDGKDETICLWDGQVRDDDVLKMINELPAGIRLVLINDQCHSEGNFRSVVRFAQRAVSFGAWGKKQATPMVEMAKGWNGQLIQFAGCREASYSYGEADGGTWTQSLLAVIDQVVTWRMWFDLANAKMPANQVPQWVEYGNVEDVFRYGGVLR